MNQPSAIRARLRGIFRDATDAEIAYLARLTSEEQEDLAGRIQSALEREGGGLFAAVAFVSNLIPAFLKAKIAQDMLGPAMCAKMSYHLPPKQIFPTLNNLKPEFLADVALHLQPEKVVEIVEGSPDSLLVKITVILIKRDQMEVLASFADHLGVPKLRILADKVVDPRALVRIARHMASQHRMLQIASGFPDERLLGLMREIAHFQYFDLAAAVGQELPAERQLRLLDRLDVAMAARLAAHYRPEIIADLMEKMDLEKAIEIGLKLEPQVLGELANIISPEMVNRFLPYMSIDTLRAALDRFNRKRLENHWNEIAPAAKDVLRRAAEGQPEWLAFLKSWG